jgi:hypothetical protein
LPPTDDQAIDFESLTEVMCAAAIRSGDLLALDRLADMQPSDRVLHATKIITQAAAADPWIAKVLSKSSAIHTMRTEIMRRRNQP